MSHVEQKGVLMGGHRAFTHAQTRTRREVITGDGGRRAVDLDVECIGVDWEGKAAQLLGAAQGALPHADAGQVRLVRHLRVSACSVRVRKVQSEAASV